MKHGLKSNIAIDNLLKQFDTHLITTSESHKKVPDYQSHFNNWLNKQDLRSSGTALTAIDS